MPETRDHPVYPNVFKSLRLGQIEVRNRIFVPAHTTNFGSDNLPSDQHVEYHRARSRGGAGLIIFEGIRVHESSLGRSQGVNGYDLSCIDRFAKVAEAVRAEGSHLFGQIIHLGRHIDGNYARMPSWSASPIPWAATAPPPHPMTIDEIEQVVDAHSIVAQNLAEAGLAGIELQMGHGHLLQQFLSPATNQREDIYGGSKENRLRFLLEVLHKVRRTIGDQLTLGIRISGDEFMKEGLTIDDMCEIVPTIAANVRLDFINISHSAYHGSYTVSTQMADMHFPKGLFQPITRRLKNALSHIKEKPVIMTVCQYRRISDAETALANGLADMVGMARAHIADPNIIEKARTARENETIPCIACNQGCADRLALALPISCIANPATGREGLNDNGKLSMSQRVLVVGGGPAGLQASWVAAEKGHKVTLWEGDKQLGGRLNWTTKMPLRHEFKVLLDYLEERCNSTGVTIELNKTATTNDILAFAPDALIIATGAAQVGERFPQGGRGLSLENALEDIDALGSRVALIDRLGTWTTSSVAEYLADIGKSVTLVVPTGVPAWTISMYSVFALRHRLAEKGVDIQGLKRPVSYVRKLLTLESLALAKPPESYEFDSVIAPTIGKPNDSLYEEIKQRVSMIRLVGDAAAPRTALEAIFEGYSAAKDI